MTNIPYRMPTEKQLNTAKDRQAAAAMLAGASLAQLQILARRLRIPLSLLANRATVIQRIVDQVPGWRLEQESIERVYREWPQ